MDSNGSGPSSHHENVLQFFLNLYKYQLGASHTDDDPSEIVPLSSENYGKEFTYELRVERQGQLKSRRMALGLMEESSGSKSTCFKVVYDDVLVVKIPPHPLINFDEYIERINVEGRIAENDSSRSPASNDRSESSGATSACNTATSRHSPIVSRNGRDGRLITG